MPQYPTCTPSFMQASFQRTGMCCSRRGRRRTLRGGQAYGTHAFICRRPAPGHRLPAVAHARGDARRASASTRSSSGPTPTARGGVCPMLAAHRHGGRTSFVSFARAWDRFARAKRAARATARELRVLEAHLRPRSSPSAARRTSAARSPSTRRSCASARPARPRASASAGCAGATTRATKSSSSDPEDVVRVETKPSRQFATRHRGESEYVAAEFASPPTVLP